MLLLLLFSLFLIHFLIFRKCGFQTLSFYRGSSSHFFLFRYNYLTNVLNVCMRVCIFLPFQKHAPYLLPSFKIINRRK